ncbi:MAG: hypothetical protein LUI12_10060 [Clostridiales bacterium]|nr:hypothetical protein [Clostridiales bacterium]
MSEVLDNLNGYLNELDNYMTRLNKNRLSRKDRKVFLEISNEYYEAFQEYYKNSPNRFLESFLEAVEAFNDNIIVNGNDKAVEMANEHYQEIKSNAVSFYDSARKAELVSGIFKKDIVAYDLRREKIVMLQELVDLDQKVLGELSQETLLVLETEHCQLVGGKVVEIPERKSEAEKSPSTAADVLLPVDGGKKDTKINMKFPGKDPYRAYVYRVGNNQSPELVYGKSPEEIISRLHLWNNGRTGSMKLRTCYIQELKPDINKFENLKKWDLLSDKDITPIYLKIPYIEDRTQFNQMMAGLKADGAKYSPSKKAYYITKQDDLSKFVPYLPPTDTQRPDQEQEHEGKQGNSRTEKVLPSELEYRGKMYDPLQYDILKLAEQQKFTDEQMNLLEHPEISADRMNEIRFAVRDGLSVEQIVQFANPSYEQWQMDICRTGLQNGFTMQELQPIIDPQHYVPEQWAARRNQLQKMIHEKNKANKNSLMERLDNNKLKTNSVQHKNQDAVQQNKSKAVLPGNAKE